MALVVEAGKSADGAEHGGGGDGDVIHFFDELFGSEAGVVASNDVEPGGAGMAVDSVRGLDSEGVLNPMGAGPVDVTFLDFRRAMVMANFAFAAVAREARDGGAAFDKQRAPAG